jgi:DNA-binding transcriptional regulator YiaG
MRLEPLVDAGMRLRCLLGEYEKRFSSGAVPEAPGAAYQLRQVIALSERVLTGQQIQPEEIDPFLEESAASQQWRLERFERDHVDDLRADYQRTLKDLRGLLERSEDVARTARKAIADQRGLLIAGRRQAKGLTQTQLAVSLGVDPATVSRWERGHTVPPGRCFDLSEVLGGDPFDYQIPVRQEACR